MKTLRGTASLIRSTFVLLLATGCWLPTAVLADNSLSFQGPEVVYGRPGTRLVVPVEVLLNSDSKVQGYSLSVAFDPGTSDFVVHSATIDGTAAAEVFDGGFKLTEIVDPTLNDQGEGVVSNVVFSFAKPVSLGPAVSPHKILRINVVGKVPPRGSTETLKLNFVNGLQGRGQPTQNAHIVNSAWVDPSTSGISINVIGRGVNVINAEDLGDGSLRQAISEASSGSTITFSKFLDGQTITLNEQILINKSLKIDASDLTHGIIIDGNRNGGIFGIVSNATVVFDSLTLTNARTDVGGAISINTGANLTLNNATLSGNSASSGGGGIFNWGTLTINNSTLSGNSALSLGGVGGGIFNAGTLTINKSTLSCNSAFVDGGGILNAGTLVLTNSTLSDNSAKWGGGIDNHGPLTLNNSTLSGNSAVNEFGGIRSTGFTPILNNSIVAGNTSSSGEPNLSALFTGGNNLTSGDPLLAPLGDYGGPTQTMPPLPGSPAIDRGGATTLTSDQRGFGRVGPPDIGAAERGGSASFLSLENVGINANGVFVVTVPNGVTVEIEYSPDLINWEIIATGITGTFVETNAGRRSAPTGFYRASQN